jgi:hypothetical protein
LFDGLNDSAIQSSWLISPAQFLVGQWFTQAGYHLAVVAVAVAVEAVGAGAQVPAAPQAA